MNKLDDDAWLYTISSKRKFIDFNFTEIWRYRDLLLLFVKRDVVTVYKQTILGPLWYLIQPLFTALTFTLIFNKVANIETGTVPPFLFNLAGVSVWNYFNTCLTSTSDTFTSNAAIFGKVYFPRIIVPLSIIISNLVKFGIQLLIFIAFYVFYILNNAQIYIDLCIVFFPFLVLLMGLLGLGIGMIISSLVTKYRDLKFLVGFGVQLLMYVSAVMYPLTLMRDKLPNIAWIVEYNPLAYIIETARFMLLGTGTFSWFGVLYTFAVTLVILFFGIIIFNRTENFYRYRIIMSNIILKAESISKQYRLGLIGTGTISHDLNRWWARLRGKEDPYIKLGSVNDRSTKADSDYVWALQDINFEVEKGEVLGIIGKNGAGKSTLLKILSRVTSPTSGVIKTKGRIASLLEVGTGFHPELTGKENIYLNGSILGMSQAEIKLKEDEIIKFSGCARYVDTPVKRYSSGMRVRLAFAVAAFLEPDILVVDEVLAVGDAEFQKKAIGKMQDISKGAGRTVLFVSHNMAAVKSLCTRAIVLEYGKTVFNGDTDSAISYYLNTSKSEIKIDKIKNRKGNGQVRVTDASIYSIDKGKSAQTGQPFYLEFLLENRTLVNSDDIRFDLRIDDYIGQRILWLSNSVLKRTKSIKAVNKVIFHMDKLNLNKGNYYVTFHITVNNVLTDWIQNAFSFEVIEGDYYGQGRLVAQNQSRVLIDYNVFYESL